MQGFLKMLKAMGIDPDALKDQAESLLKRFTEMEENFFTLSSQFRAFINGRYTEMEAEIAAIKAHLNMDDAPEIAAEADIPQITASGSTKTIENTSTADAQSDQSKEGV